MSRTKAGTLGVRALKQKCAGLVSSVRNRGVASEHEIEKNRPGGEGNPDRSIWGWLHYHSVLHRYLERENIAAGRSVRPDQRSKQGQASSPGEEEVLLSMIGNIAERVHLSTPLGEDRSITDLTVEPKGLLAFVEIDALDQDCRWLAARLVVLQELADTGGASPTDLQAAQLVAQRIVELQARLVWIVTSPGSRCPYDAVREASPSVPAHLLDLDPLDLTRILITHRRVNGARTMALAPFVPKDKPSLASPSWSVFIAATAREIKEDPEVLLRDWSLQKIVASAALAAKARLDAEEQAKKEAAAKSKTA